MSAAAIALAHATARPTPITDDPTYSGCAVQRYGPVEVTSLAFLTWPAAQIRIASPALAMPAQTRGGSAERRRSTAVNTSSTSMSMRHIVLSLQRRRWRHWQIASRDTTASAGDHGPLRDGRVGP